MTNPQRDKCAELVEEIRKLSLRPKSDDAGLIVETWDQVDEKRETIREYCDQLIMILQPITIRREPYRRR